MSAARRPHRTRGDDISCPLSSKRYADSARRPDCRVVAAPCWLVRRLPGIRYPCTTIDASGATTPKGFLPIDRQSHEHGTISEVTASDSSSWKRTRCLKSPYGRVASSVEIQEKVGMAPSAREKALNGRPVDQAKSSWQFSNQISATKCQPVTLCRMFEMPDRAGSRSCDLVRTSARLGKRHVAS